MCSVRDDGGPLSKEELGNLAQYFNEEVIAAANYKRAADILPRHPYEGWGTDALTSSLGVQVTYL
jgi:hypothetical protein